MKFEYQQDSLVLKILDTSHTGEVLDFYKRNKDSFEKYETDKPSNFYTYTFIYNLLKAEYNACIHGKHIRFFCMTTVFRIKLSEAFHLLT